MPVPPLIARVPHQSAPSRRVCGPPFDIVTGFAPVRNSVYCRVRAFQFSPMSSDQRKCFAWMGGMAPKLLRLVLDSRKVEYRYRRVAKHREYHWRRLASHPAAVLSKRHVAHVEYPVLYPPVPPRQLKKPRRVRLLPRQRCNPIGYLVRRRAVCRALSCYLEDLPAARPVDVSLKRGCAYKPSLLPATVPLAGRLGRLPLSLGEFSFPRGKGLSPQTPALSTP